MTFWGVLAGAILVEEAVLLSVIGFAEGRRRLVPWLLLVLGANLVTIPALNLAADALPAGRSSETPWLLGLEAIVVLIEAGAYAWGGGLRFLTAFLIALLANGASFLFGAIAGP